MNINVVILGGNLTKDVEIKYTPNGTAICDFSIANNRKYKSGDEVKEEVSFIGLTAFGKTAETINQYFKKGSPILIEGRIKTDTWEKDGKKQSKTKVLVERFHFIGNRKEETQDANWGNDEAN